MRQQNYIETIEQHLTELQGGVRPELQLLLNLLEDSINLYERVSEDINNNPLKNNRGFMNPSISIRKDLFNQITTLYKQLCTSIPYTELKNKKITTDEDGDLLEILTR